MFTNFSSVSGPGLYDPKVSNKKVGNTMVYKERRMKFKASEVPGPGAYEVIYRTYRSERGPCPIDPEWSLLFIYTRTSDTVL